MQSLHRGSFCVQDGEKPVDMLSGVLGTSRLICASSITRHFRVHIRRSIGVSAKGAGFYLQEDFWLENAYIKETVVRDVQKSLSDHRRCLQAR